MDDQGKHRKIALCMCCFFVLSHHSGRLECVTNLLGSMLGTQRLQHSIACWTSFPTYCTREVAAWVAGISSNVLALKFAMYCSKTIALVPDASLSYLMSMFHYLPLVYIAGILYNRNSSKYCPCTFLFAMFYTCVFKENLIVFGPPIRRNQCVVEQAWPSWAINSTESLQSSALILACLQ